MAEGRRGLRVLMTADTLGGIWDYALELAAQLAGNEVDIVLATMGRLPTADQRRAAAAIPDLVLQESPFKLEWMPDAGDDPLRAGEWLLQLERRFAPDLVHLNGYVHAGLPWRAPCLAVAHSCVLSWWLAVKGEPAPDEWQGYAAGVQRGLSQASAVVAPTGALLHSLEGLYGRLPHASVIWNGRCPQRYRPGIKGSFIFSAGRLWDEAKNLRALTAVAADLQWPVIAAGEWRHPNGGGELPAPVEYLGTLSAAEMTGWLSRAPIYALPALYEPFGLSVLEAALSGCALVLGDIPSLRELWDGAALFVPPDDHSRLRIALQALIDDQTLRLALSRAARERSYRYGAERMTAAYLSLYCDLLHLRPALRTGRRLGGQPAPPAKT